MPCLESKQTKSVGKHPDFGMESDFSVLRDCDSFQCNLLEIEHI